MGAKVPTLRPPAARSSVLFFTIGDAEAAQNPPQVDERRPRRRTLRARRPGPAADPSRPHLALRERRVRSRSRPSADPRSPIPLDPRTLAAPVIERSQLERAGFRARVALTGHVGFDPLARERLASVEIALPHPAPWAVAPHRTAHRSPAVRSTSSPPRHKHPACRAPSCRSADAPPVPLALKHLDDRRVELQGVAGACAAGQSGDPLFAGRPASPRADRERGRRRDRTPAGPGCRRRRAGGSARATRS